MTLTPHERRGVTEALLGELSAPALKELKHFKSEDGRFNAVIWTLDITEGRSPFIYDIRNEYRVLKRAVWTQHLEQLEESLIYFLRKR